MRRAFVARALSRVREFQRADDGLAVTEYGFLIALVAVVLIAAVKVVGGDLAAFFSKTGSTITAVEPAK